MTLNLDRMMSVFYFCLLTFSTDCNTSKKLYPNQDVKNKQTIHQREPLSHHCPPQFHFVNLKSACLMSAAWKYLSIALTSCSSIYLIQTLPSILIYNTFLLWKSHFKQKIYTVQSLKSISTAFEKQPVVGLHQVNPLWHHGELLLLKREWWHLL